MRMVRFGSASRKETCEAGESDDITRTRDVCAKIRGRPLRVSPFLCRYSTSSIPADRNTSIGAPCSTCRRMVFDGVYTMWTAAPDSRSNIGRISLSAGLKLGGAPTVRGSACPGSQVPTRAASPMIAAIATLNFRICTLNLRKAAGSVNDALVPARRIIYKQFASYVSWSEDGKITLSVGALQCFNCRSQLGQRSRSGATDTAHRT